MYLFASSNTAIYILKLNTYAYNRINYCRLVGALLYSFKRSNGSIKFNNMIYLFVISILVFLYICYVLVKPEKF